MDMYQKRELRVKKKQEDSNNDKSCTSVNINWFPGHMQKTKKQIIEDLKIVDIIIELRDARIPLSSKNPIIEEITKNKRKIIVLNKSDLANEEESKRWLEYFRKAGIEAVLTDSSTGRGLEECVRRIEKIMSDVLETQAQKGRIGRKIRAMILGIPNVGKSSFINRIAKKSVAGVGNKPGVTRQKQWIRINDKIELLDTPGVLWPKFESQKVGLRLAFTGTIKEEILDKTEIAYYLTKFLLENNKNSIVEKYKIEKEVIEKILNEENSENENIYNVMLEIGRRRGCIMQGNKIDEEKTARIILDEFKNGKLGKITIEKVKE